MRADSASNENRNADFGVLSQSNWLMVEQRFIDLVRKRSANSEVILNTVFHFIPADGL